MKSRLILPILAAGCLALAACSGGSKPIHGFASQATPSTTHTPAPPRAATHTPTTKLAFTATNTPTVAKPSPTPIPPTATPVPPTATALPPTATPTATPSSAAVSVAAPACYKPGVNSCNCSNFATHAQAQQFHDTLDPNDINKLDSDHDGVVCESLP